MVYTPSALTQKEIETIRKKYEFAIFLIKTVRYPEFLFYGKMLQKLMNG